MNWILPKPALVLMLSLSIAGCKSTNSLRSSLHSVTERNSEQATERTTEQVTERATEQATERTTEQATEQVSEQATERATAHQLAQKRLQQDSIRETQHSADSVFVEHTLHTETRHDTVFVTRTQREFHFRLRERATAAQALRQDSVLQEKRERSNQRFLQQRNEQQVQRSAQQVLKKEQQVIRSEQKMQRSEQKALRTEQKALRSKQKTLRNKLLQKVAGWFLVLLIFFVLRTYLLRIFLPRRNR